jgi:hypothetical protein
MDLHLKNEIEILGLATVRDDKWDQCVNVITRLM